MATHMYLALVIQRVGSHTETHPIASATHPQRTASASSTVDTGSETLDVAGAAERLKVSGKTVRRLVKADIIPFARIGTRLWFHRQRLIEWIAEGGGRSTRSLEEVGPTHGDHQETPHARRLSRRVADPQGLALAVPYLIREHESH
jgi:excisionase family DNA binding protein